jgi:hypothetical protein
MATARDVIAGAYQRLGLLPLGADLDPDRGAAGLIVYNDMLNAWAADGIGPGAPALPSVPADGELPPLAADASPLSLGLNDAFPFPAQFVEGAKAMLAVELAPGSGMEAQPSIRLRAKQAYDALLARYVIAPQAQQDTALTTMPSLRLSGFRSSLT